MVLTNSKKQKRILNILRTLAMSGDTVRSSRHAACIVYKNDIIAFGQNKFKSRPFQQKFSKNEKAIFIHAETEAIYNALKRLTVDELAKSKLYVLRLRKDHKVSNSCPCDGCKKAIKTFNIKQVFFTSENIDGFECLF
jgi:deoxycytidylate deaminase